MRTWDLRKKWFTLHEQQLKIRLHPPYSPDLNPECTGENGPRIGRQEEATQEELRDHVQQVRTADAPVTVVSDNGLF